MLSAATRTSVKGAGVIQGVIFDMDGVLVDSEELICEAAIQMFAEHGTVTSVALITDRDTGAPRGFGFVEMEDGGDEAINALNNHEIGGRNLKVNEAKPREQRSRW